MLIRFEYRYPCLDRDIVDFVFRIPREQLVRPKRRRSLMRRAMDGIVPTAIVERRRKAYIVNGPLMWIERHHSEVDNLFSRSHLVELNIINSTKLRECLRTMVATNQFQWLPALNRAIALEIWLQSRATRFAA